MSYVLLKNIHLICIGLTFLSFSVRFIWMLMDSKYLHLKVTRILPHLIDTVLLASAIGLSITLHQYPMVNHWLTAKVIGLLIYIFAGTIALKRGKTKRIRIMAGILAFASFFYIVGVAFSKNALFFI